MTKKEIVTKAIEKAVKNGWSAYRVYNEQTRLIEVYIPEGFDFDGDIVIAIIFSHDFACAFWGDEDSGIIPESRLGETMGPIWQHHLCMMVLEENPLDYLAKFIND